MIELVNAAGLGGSKAALESVAILSVPSFFDGFDARPGPKNIGFSGVRVEILPGSPLYHWSRAPKGIAF